jgi:hypothetical protein
MVAFVGFVFFIVNNFIKLNTTKVGILLDENFKEFSIKLYDIDYFRVKSQYLLDICERI